MKSEFASGTTYTGAAIAVGSGLSLNEIGVIVGIVLGVAGFLYNVYAKERLIKIAKNKGVNVVEE